MKRVRILGDKTEISRYENSIASAFPHLSVVKDGDCDILCLLPGCKDWYSLAQSALSEATAVYAEGYPTRDAEQIRALCALAAENNTFFGGGSDTFLGAGLQTARKLIDEGFIGAVLGAQVKEIREQGSILNALLNLLGKATAVSVMKGQAGGGLSEKDPGVRGANIRFSDGSICQLFLLPELFSGEKSQIEIYGTEGTLRISEPEGYGGEISLLRAGQKEYCKVPMMFHYGEDTPGLGLADMAEAMETGKTHRANGTGMAAVTEILAVLYSDEPERKEIKIKSPFRRMPAMRFSHLIGKGE